MKKYLFTLLLLLPLSQIDAQTLINEGFEASPLPAGWLKSNIAGNPWTGPYSSSTYAHTGTYSMYCTQPSTGPNNDSWLYSTGVSLTAGTQYYTEFYTRTFSTSDYQSLYLYIGEGQTPAAQTNLLVGLPIFASPAYIKESTIFTAPATGTYNLGFHDLSVTSASPGAGFVDDVLLRVAIPGSAPPINFIGTVAFTSITLQWTDNSTNEAAFRVYRSTDSVTFSPVGSDIVSTTTASTGTTYTVTENGLLPYTKYYYRIVSVADIVSSTYLSGNATTSYGNEVAIFSSGWSLPLTWSLGRIPTAGDSVTISNGISVDVDIPNAVCYKLYDTGTLSYDATSIARALTVDSDMIIASTGQFLAAITNPASSTTHSIAIGGSLTNRGIIGCHNTSNAFVNMTFTGAGNNSFITSPTSTTDLHTITINKGTSTSSLLNFQPGNSFTTDLSSGTGFLTLTNGTFEITGTQTQTSNLFSTASYDIPNNSGFWLNDPNFTVSAQNSSHNFNGLFRLTSGTFNVGAVSANLTYADSGAKWIVEGGTMNVGGSLTLGNNIGDQDDTLIQTGGTINFVTGASQNESFEIAGLCYHSMSGGSMHFIQPCTSPFYDIDFNNQHAVSNITGGSIYMGGSSTAAGSTFVVSGIAYNMYIDSVTHPKTCEIYYAGVSHPMSVFGNMYISGTSTFDVDQGTFLFAGDTLTNNGTILSSDNSYIKIFGNNQVYTGSGVCGTIAAPLGNVATGMGIDDSSLTLLCTNPIILYRVNLFAGLVHNASKFKIGVADGVAEVVQFGSTGLARPVNFDVAPDYSTLGTGGFVLYYVSMPGNFYTGVEIPPTRTVLNIGIYTSDSLTLTGGNLNISANFLITQSILTTDTNNVLVLQNTAQYAPSTGDSASYVNGPLAMLINTANDTVRTFAVGKAGAYRPVTLSHFHSGGTLQEYTVEVMNGNCTGAGSGVSLDSTRYYHIKNTANIHSSTTAQVQLNYGTDDHIGPVSSEIVGQSGTSNGLYISIGHSSIVPPYISSSSPIIAGNDYFVLGNSNVSPGTWLGGISSDWNNVSNWAWSTPPYFGISAIIPSGTPYAPVIYTGTHNADSITIAAGNTLTLSSGTSLSVTGNINNNTTVSGAGKIIMNSPNAREIEGKGTISNLEINSTGGATAVSINPGDSLYMTGVLTLTNGMLTTNSGLVLVSDASGTGSIGTITGGGITGNVTTQQYIAGGRRAFRFLGHPFTSGISLSQLENYIDITGKGGIANGFTTTITNNPSAFWYRPQTGDGSTVDDVPGWIAYVNTDGIDTNAWNQYEGIRVLVRGQKGQGLNGYPYTPLPVTYSLTGQVNTGAVNIPMHLGAGSPYNLVSNPYPSPVDIGTVINNAKAAGAIAGPAFWVWNTNDQLQGAYIPTIISSTPYNIEANASFEVAAAFEGAQLSFAESNKAAVRDSELFKTESVDNYISLHVYDTDYHSWDRLYLQFKDDATAAKEQHDAPKLHNSDLDFYSFSSDNKKLCVDARPFADNKIIPLGIIADVQQPFIIKAENLHLSEGAKLYLHDKYTGVYQLLADGTEYTFSITSDSLSQGDDRFELSMEQVATNVAVVKNNTAMAISPNPATDEVTIVYHLTTGKAANITLTDISGVCVMKKEVAAQLDGTVKLNLAGIATGMYNVSLQSGENVITQKLIKL